jgi:hypothetical protein
MSTSPHFTYLLLSTFLLSTCTMATMVLPTFRDTVRHSWLHGPSISSKLGGGWPQFGSGGGSQLHLRFSEGHCLFSSGNELKLQQSYNYNSGLMLEREGEVIKAAGGKILCGDGTNVMLKSSCEFGAWEFLTNGAFRHVQTGRCLAPTGSLFGR